MLIIQNTRTQSFVLICVVLPRAMAGFTCYFSTQSEYSHPRGRQNLWVSCGSEVSCGHVLSALLMHECGHSRLAVCWLNVADSSPSDPFMRWHVHRSFSLRPAWRSHFLHVTLQCLTTYMLPRLVRCMLYISLGLVSSLRIDATFS